MRPVRTLSLLLGAAMLALLLFLAACDTSKDDAPKASTARPGPTLPFPPQAFEPATSKGVGPRPAGRVIRIGGRPEGAAVDPVSETLGVALDDSSHGFALLDARTLKVRKTVPLLAGARHVTQWNGTFLVPMEDAGMLAQVPADGGAQTLTKVGRNPHFATAAGDQIFVENEFDGTVSVIRDGKVRATVPVDVQPGGIADVGGGQLAVVSVRAYTVQLMDRETLKTGPSQNAGYGPSHAVATPDGRVLVADTRGGGISVFETRPRLKFVQRLQLGGSPYGLAFDTSRRRLWVTDSGADKLYQIDASAKLKVMRTLPTVQQPNTVAVDERTGDVYVIGHAKGELQKITG